MVELGRIDINIEVPIMGLQLALPREVNLEAVLNIFSYLRGKHNSRLALDITYLEIDHASFKNYK